MAEAVFVNDARVMSKGQVTIPKKVRVALGIETGDRVTFIVDGGNVRVVNSAIYALQRCSRMDHELPERESRRMKIMIDTNIVISAVLFPNGKAAQAFYKALLPPYEPLLCDYVIDELHRKFKEKFPERQMELEAFLLHAFLSIRTVQTPEEEMVLEKGIRDPKDRPILRAALNAHADLFLTGDKDFLESAVTDPRVVSVTSFLEM